MAGYMYPGPNWVISSTDSFDNSVPCGLKRSYAINAASCALDPVVCRQKIPLTGEFTHSTKPVDKSDHQNLSSTCDVLRHISRFTCLLR